MEARVAQPLTWYGLLLPNGNALMGHDSKQKARAWVGEFPIAALITVRFKSRAHMIGFFDQRNG